ncbi:Mal regulon transcriptional regulator MalI [Rouxiella badensis]|jgi:LacI family transcriptional regulator of maltose regulon|uniref:Mal regulon transcriptional regulator MalI n=1 Tax=Rouxiella badensis TaxID=1646377 RepID=A0A1X0WGZ0_9GAMM|nr:Mal regulon transcriptional regulator MalI [Rouxiella badensis]MCC3718070.1 Mal regulon transcriptional regulator MalI [Rouxiella badensis]MCC3727162.1 Mal regulon transcriptional regulator MalI [Rouxiella badensis]MCC3731554.1 Mal regulon transcriptional regulator MalI [Rouxiella badensis]MCC3738489.1 Mal regulon transcriptional regulator MalI [Rouxiella badensis]MCC3748961.1 Mal regulon transcriptional regulator MalI [Rouxiella badensis]
MMSKKVTITDVASTAGVSVATVSLVLSGKGRISQATSARVNQAIEQLGFVRNRQASSLRGGESGVIGLIVRDICEPFYAEMTAGLSEMFEAQGKVIFLLQSGATGKGLERCFDTLLTHGVDGIVIAGGIQHVNHSLREKAAAQGVPLICASRSGGSEGVDLVRPDNMQAAKIATEYLIRHGHKQIAYLGGLGSSLTRAERLGGFCATLLQYGLPFRSEWIIECDYHYGHAADAAESLLRRYPKISAIVCHKASVALGAYFGVLRTGNQVAGSSMDNLFQRQVALIGIEDSPELALTEPPLTSVSSSAREIGYAAARRLLLRIGGQNLETQDIIVNASIVERGSA